MVIKVHTTWIPPHYEFRCPICDYLTFSKGEWDTAQCECGALVLKGAEGYLSSSAVAEYQEK